MSKNRKKSLRTIIVDGEEYKWLMDLDLKVWKDKKVIFDYWGKYPKVSYNLEEDGYGPMTPRIVAKIIRLINGSEDLIPNRDLLYRMEHDRNLAIGYYGRHASFEDKETERLWAKFNDSHKALAERLEHQKLMNSV